MNKKYVVLQDGIKECGASCMLSIIRFYGGNICLNYLLELTHTDKSGTNFFDMSLAFSKLGFDSKGYNISNIDELIDFNLPFISQVSINNFYHFVVVYKINSKKVVFMDPVRGMVSENIKNFTSIFTGNILLSEPRKILPLYQDDNYLLCIIKNVLLSNRRLIIKLLIITIMVTIFTCLYNCYFKIIIDYVIDSKVSILKILTFIFMIILVLNQLFNFIRNKLIMVLNKKIDYSIITKTVSKIISLPYCYYKNKTTGEIISRVNDLLFIKNFVSRFIVIVFLDFILSIVVLVLLFKINIMMTLVVLLIAIIYFLLFLIFKNPIKVATKKIQEDNAMINSLLVESISSYETIKGLNIEGIFKGKINGRYYESISDNFYLNKIINIENFIKNVLEGILLLIITFIGSKLIIKGDFSIGSLVIYNSLLIYFLGPIKNSFEIYRDFNFVGNSIKNINNILNYKYEKLDKNSNLFFDNSINIKNFSFGYIDRKVILNDINLFVPKSSKVLILGSSGCGKSTLLKVLNKYYTVARNKIFYGNYDINDFTLKDIRDNVTYISQNELLYTGTVKDNILLDRTCDDSEFYKICKITYVTDMINEMHVDYDYFIEENGANLSGGQKQRIVLARSLIKKSKIILIDEGLNEIDTKLERNIIKNMFQYYNDMMFLIVSHRNENYDLYDMIISMNDGIVIETKMNNVVNKSYKEVL